MAFVCASHRDVGAHERARYALALRSGSAPPLSSEGGVTQISSATAPSSPQTLTWRYAAHRVVVLVDVRRSTRDWVDGVVGALDGVLSALTSGPLDGAPPPTLHVSVVLGARLGAPTRVLVQGWRLRVGEPAAALRAHVRRQAVGAAEADASSPPPPPHAAPPHGLHAMADLALFCLSLLPAHASPSLAVLTDGVGAPLDEPLLALRQADVQLLVLLLAPPAALEAPLGLLADADAHRVAAESAGGVLLRCPPPPPRGARASRAPPPPRSRARSSAAPPRSTTPPRRCWAPRCRRRRCGRSRRRSPPTSRRRGRTESASTRTSCRAASPSPTCCTRASPTASACC